MISVSLLGVSARFGSQPVLEKVELQVQPGELFFLLGPSGCGKTTLLRIIAGLCQPSAGRLLFDGRDVTDLPVHQRNTAMVFQSYALWPHMNVEQNVAFGLQERKLPKAEIQVRTREALEAVQMAELGERKIHQLSGGQQQRVALARALSVRPDCLLLDEPLSNLDAQLRHQMRSQIRDICRKFRLTAIYVTHDQKEALSIADRIAILDKGRLAQVGTPRELYQRPQSRQVAAFLGETNFIEGVLKSLTKNQARVETALGTFQGIAPRGLQPGAPVTLMVRPECWRLGTRAEVNSVAGTITDSVYLGEMIQHTFLTPAQKLLVLQLNPRLEDPTQREGLHLRVDPEDVIVLES